MGRVVEGLLLDTHVWIWSQESPDELGPKTKKALTDLERPLYVSTISTLEIARLVQKGRIHIEGSLADWMAQSLRALGANTIDLTHDAAMEAYALPGTFHPDPADRMLTATARKRALRLVTADQRILTYRHVKTLSARS